MRKPGELQGAGWGGKQPAGQGQARPAELVSVPVWQLEGKSTNTGFPALLPAAEVGVGTCRLEAAGLPPGLGSCQPERDHELGGQESCGCWQKSCSNDGSREPQLGSEDNQDRRGERGRRGPDPAESGTPCPSRD